MFFICFFILQSKLYLDEYKIRFYGQNRQNYIAFHLLFCKNTIFFCLIRLICFFFVILQTRYISVVLVKC